MLISVYFAAKIKWRLSDETNQTITVPAAKTLSKQRRKSIALSVIRNEQAITNAAKTHNVSRQFIHAQKNKAIDGVNQSFQADNPPNDKVLFYLPERLEI